MKINIINSSKKTVHLQINNADESVLKPKESFNKDIDGSEFTISVRHNIASFRDSSRSRYVLVVETEYVVNEAYDGECLILSHRLDNVNDDIQYDRFYVHSDNATCREVNYLVVDKQEILQECKKRSLADLLFDIFGVDSNTIILPLFVAIIVYFFQGLKLAFITFLIIYGICILITLIISKLADIFFNKLLKTKSDMRIIQAAVDENSISEFYKRR